MRFRSSNIKKFNQCNRLWYLQEVLGHEQQSKKCFSDGTEGHKIHELYLTEGIAIPDTPMGRIAQQGFKFLPTHRTNLRIEKTFKIQIEMPDGFVITFDSTPDLQDFNDPEVTYLYDYKFVNGFKYAMKPEELQRDIQALSYAYNMYENEGAKRVVGRWIYHDKNLKGARMIEAELPREIVYAQWQKSLQVMWQMVLLEQQKPEWEQVANALDGDGKACWAYGGCDFRSQCRQEKNTGENSIMSSLLEKLRAGQKKAAAPVEKAQTIIIDDPVAVNPPDASPAIYDDNPPAEKKKGKKKINPEQLDMFEGDFLIGDVPVAIKLPTTKTQTELVTAPSKPSVTEVTTVDEETSSTTPSKLCVYIDCIPSKGSQFVALDDILQPLASMLAAVHDVPDILLLDYAKGGPLLAAAFAEQCETIPLPKSLFVRSQSPYSKFVISYLTSKATIVVNGL